MEPHERGESDRRSGDDPPREAVEREADSGPTAGGHADADAPESPGADPDPADQGMAGAHGDRDDPTTRLPQQAAGSRLRMEERQSER